MEDIKIVLFIISWLVFGFISMLMLATHDLRGKEYNEKYFNVIAAITIICFGYMGFIVTCCMLINEIIKKTINIRKSK